MIGGKRRQMADQTLSQKAESLIPKFKLDRVLNHDPGAKRVVLLGSIDSQEALLIIERTAFPSEAETLSNLAPTLQSLQNLGTNDIYHWFLATSPSKSQPPDLKLNLICPCSQKHIAKYSPQQYRTVTETPEIYANHVRPYMASQRDQGRLDWVFNIIDGSAEQEDVIYRENDPVTGFLVSPDLNWDRKTITALHILALVERRDIWSLRDLQHEHVEWLKRMRRKILDAVTGVYKNIEEDQLKLYVHYQPTYYHFHVHVVHVALEAGVTQAVGKAFGLDNLISQLECMAESKSMADLSITYTIGEAHELWKSVYAPAKNRSST